MSESLIGILAAAMVSIIASVSGTAIVWFKAREAVLVAKEATKMAGVAATNSQGAKHLGETNAEKIQSVHEIVNNKNDVLTAAYQSAESKNEVLQAKIESLITRVADLEKTILVQQILIPAAPVIKETPT